MGGGGEDEKGQGKSTIGRGEMRKVKEKVPTRGHCLNNGRCCTHRVVICFFA